MNCEMMSHEGEDEIACACEKCWQRLLAERDEARETASLFLAQLHVRGIEGIGWREVEWLQVNSPPDPERA